MTKEDLTFYQEQAQWHYRDTHPSCIFCEHCSERYYDLDMFLNRYYYYKCIITNKEFRENKKWKNKKRAENCMYYIAKTDI